MTTENKINLKCSECGKQATAIVHTIPYCSEHYRLWKTGRLELGQLKKKYGI